MHDPVDAWSLAAITERLEGDRGVSYRRLRADFSPARPEYAGGGEH